MNKPLLNLPRGIFYLLLWLPVVLTAQPLEVSNTAPITPENLITNVFLGEGVEVIDVDFSGSGDAVGFFRNGEDEIGLDRGIVMSTGFAATGLATLGVDGQGFQQASASTSGPASDPDMLQISDGVAINDMVRYLITFVPISDTLRFRYVFASEEYPEFACSEYNDIFGFFISGPGINGPFSNNAENIALVPETNLPVTINTVNPGMIGSQAGDDATGCDPPDGSLNYSQYYNSNLLTLNQPVFDGFTNVFTAEAVVVPCSTYTIKLVICDVNDSGWDSGVFLEAKSFGTGSLNVEVVTASLDGTVAEGCTDGMLVFSLPSRAESDYAIDYNIIGTAENGVDYEFIPPGLAIPAGDSSISIPIIAFEDGLAEGFESILVDVQRDVCNRDTVIINIRDNILVPASLGADTSICLGDTVSLDGELDVPLPQPLTFYSQDTLNLVPSNVTLYSDIEVAGVLPANLLPGVIQSVCIEDLQHGWVDDLRIFLSSPGGQFIELVTDIGNQGDDFIGTCFTPTATVPITSVDVDDAPFTGSFLPEGVWEDLYGDNNPTNGTWRLGIFDKFAPDVGVLNRWSITFNPIYTIQYNWEPATGLSCTDCSTPQAFPGATTAYVMTAIDSYGCETSDSTQVEVFSTFEAPVLNCSLVANESITISWEDVPGASAYEVNVDGAGWIIPSGANQHTVDGLSPGAEVMFEVRALGSCSAVSTISCQIPTCTPPTITTNNLTSPTCYGGNDGAVSLAASGTPGPYEFTLNGMTNSTGQFSGLPAGNYTLEVVGADGCPAVSQLVISQPDSLEAVIIASDLLCFGQPDGEASLNVTNGNGPFTYNWSDGQSDPTATGLSAGTYTVTVTDANGCTHDFATILNQPDSLGVEVAVDSVLCNGGASGAALGTASGGTGDYNYTFPPGITIGNTPNAAVGLAAGQYMLSVTDVNGCEAVANFEVFEPEALSLMVATENITCQGARDGAATISVDGGSGSYTYLWQDGQLNTVSEDSTANDLAEGSYTVMVTDNKGCFASETITLQEPLAIVAQVETVPASCPGVEDGAASLQLSGGVPGYEIEWPELGLSGVTQLTNLSAGQYTYIITDANQCQLVDSLEITSPQPITLTFEVAEPSCFGDNDGQAIVVAEGGAGNYSYLWGDGQTTAMATGISAGPVSVLIRDENECEVEGMVTVGQPPALELSLMALEPSCNNGTDGRITAQPVGGTGSYTFNWSNGQATPVANGLSAGTYWLEVNDANGCQAIDTLSLEEPLALESSIVTESASCLPTPDGAARVEPQGGTPPYTFRWNDGQSTADAQQLEAGTYVVTITDSKGCTLMDTATVEGIPPINLTIATTDASCYDGTDGAASVTAAGGSGVYTYNWGSALPQSASIANINSGNYSVTVTDELGCTAITSAFVGQPARLSLTTAVQGVSCSGSSDGRITLSVQGGTAPYTFLWNTGDTSSVADGLGIGGYSATVTDDNGCTGSTNASINALRPIEATLEIVPVLCFGGRTGSALASVEGGLSPYSYSWSNGATSSAIQDVSSGDYSLSITDAAGCEVVEEVVIPQPAEPLLASVEATPSSCFGADDGRLDITPSGGTAPYRYSLGGSFFSGSSSFIRLEPGPYRAEVEDAAGCTYLTDEVEVTEPVPIEVQLGESIPVNFGESTILEPEIQGGQGALAYSWSPQDSSQLSCFDCLNPEATVAYQVSFRLEVMDEKGCTGRDIVTVYAKKDRPVFVPTGFTPNGDNSNDRLLVHARTGVDMAIRYFRVFDRWGEMVFEATGFAPNDPNVGWDGAFRGEPAPAGVYIWHLGVAFSDGFEEEFTGNTTLIR